ncbi:hypothetical protein B9Z55_020373 [Caenorhabditis nigoni]|uniref:SPK domain-containing protein n=2 Tax=Caenorhabditis nigoni TaxID=1611254 RepID=A0A2G5TMJ1_9PELO|nr:hypothetical protein B9Z55_020373 [Caenorhabditis nigoni]
MKHLIITQDMQQDFLNAIENRGLENWCKEKRHLLNFIDNSLKKITIPRSNREKEHTCEFICKTFWTLFTINWESTQLNPDTIEGKFLLQLKASYESNLWDQFYNSYEDYFDSLILYMRTQKTLDIWIEDLDGNLWETFHESKMSSNEIQRSKTDMDLMEYEFNYKRSKEKQKAFEDEQQKENSVHQTEIEEQRRKRELLDEENDIRMQPSGPRIANVERIV